MVIGDALGQTALLAIQFILGKTVVVHHRCLHVKLPCRLGLDLELVWVSVTLEFHGTVLFAHYSKTGCRAIFIEANVWLRELVSGSLVLFVSLVHHNDPCGVWFLIFACIADLELEVRLLLKLRSERVENSWFEFVGADLLFTWLLRGWTPPQLGPFQAFWGSLDWRFVTAWLLEEGLADRGIIAATQPEITQIVNQLLILVLVLPSFTSFHLRLRLFLTGQRLCNQDVPLSWLVLSSCTVCLAWLLKQLMVALSEEQTLLGFDCW